MMLSRPYRALALPALAILVPSAFIALLAVQWLAVEQEAARLRGAEAATTALAELRQSLLTLVEEAGRTVLPRLADTPHALPQPDSPWPSIIAEAFLFDGAGRVAADGQTVRDNSTVSPHAKAAALLAAGTEALSAGRLGDADKAAAQLATCCGGARDEFGVAYAIYAAWQQLAIDSRQPNAARPPAIVRHLRDAIERGDLTQPSDIVGIRLLAEKLADAAGAAGLVALVEQTVAAAERGQDVVRAAESWIASVDWGSASQTEPLSVSQWRTATAATIAAAWRPTPTQTVALVLDLSALGEWVSHWAPARSSFVFALNPAAAGVTDAVLTAPLFAAAPGLTVTVRRGPNDPATDRRRQRLFMTAAAVGLILTLMAGYLAARDAFRELRTAALRSTFLAGVTHEIRTPLTSIRLLAETLQQKRVSPDEADELLGTIVNEAEHLSGLVDNVLGTSRIESGTRTYHPQLVSVTDVVRATHRRFEYTLAKEGFTLIESIPSAPLWIRADPDALAQAVLNLLGNATKYSGASREIRLTVGSSATHAMVQVADDGVGVPAKEQSRIFDSFYRARGTSAETTGTGLGLALVKHFAEAHGGRVTLASTPGRGSVFTIALPLAKAPERGTSANG